MSEDPASGEDLLASLCSAAHDLVARTKGPITRLAVQAGDYRIEIEWDQSGVQPATAGAVTVTPGQVAVEEAPAVERQAVVAPLVGTFYRCPEPGADPFVEEGDVIEAGQPVAIIEAMKIMNLIESELAGRVSKILVGDGEVVEYGQELILVEPADTGDET